jgi:hypothetical protein
MIRWEAAAQLVGSYLWGSRGRSVQRKYERLLPAEANMDLV